MYGIINKSIEDLVKSNFGAEKWNVILDKSGIEHNYFISSEPYDDDITFKLVNAIAMEMDMSLESVLYSFGEWWIIKTTKDKYSGLMETGGNNLRDFLINLPLFHNRVMLLFPKLTPPEFKISDIEQNSLQLHYFSKREGLQEFVRGLIQGLGIMFKTEIEIELLKTRQKGDNNEVFKISWK
ncbi:heme NO-binding domain-containing protein [Flavobacterium sp. J49]|uniref:heme NO-binding domain-containing protein n=1 Tax=Flavobacterium sp. J49 TaxID=2718534 RepID=UPI001594448F|nr:heme NO-binding domain-containing protein [Flavobacterium sp. J49]MBF6642193.1 heme NO-binding domain-containing protein [Flavobacterium sp. J49]NIC03440.1 heme NO-binding protein [Flavobacterium sp. J49]